MILVFFISFALFDTYLTENNFFDNLVDVTRYLALPCWERANDLAYSKTANPV